MNEKETLWWMLDCPKSEPCYCKEECMYLRQKSLEQERNMYKASSEVFYGRLKRAHEEQKRLFERLKDITSTLGGVTFTDGRQWGAYNALCDILEEIEKELSK